MFTTLAEIPDSSIVTVALPWGVWLGIGGAVLAAFAWLARLTLKALSESRESVKEMTESSKEMHDEVVALTREVVSSMTDNTAALREIAQSTEALTTVVLKEKDDDK